MKMAEWDKTITKFKRALDAIAEEVYIEQDEVKAMGELSLLEKDINFFIHKNWVNNEK